MIDCVWSYTEGTRELLFAFSLFLQIPGFRYDLFGIFLIFLHLVQCPVTFKSRIELNESKKREFFECFPVYRTVICAAIFECPQALFFLIGIKLKEMYSTWLWVSNTRNYAYELTSAQGKSFFFFFSGNYFTVNKKMNGCFF